MFSNDEMDFTELIQSYFLKRTGKGLIFSSRDLDLILKWESLGCSPATICKGIDLAVEKSRRTPRDLFGCRKYIEEGFGPQKKKGSPPKKRPVEKSAVPPSNAAAKQGGEAGTALIESLVRAYPHADFQALYEVAIVGSDFFDFEERLFTNAFLSLSPDEQMEMDAGIVEKFRSVLGTMSDKARSATIAAKRRSLMEEKMGRARPALVAQEKKL